jgi:hypothetical protein
MLFVVLDPSPSRGLNPTERLAFWTLHIYIPLALAQGCQIILAYNWPNFGNVWALTSTAAIAASALFAPFALALDLVFGVAWGLTQDERFRLTEVIDEWLNLAPPVMLVWVGLNAARFLRLPGGAPPPKTSPLGSQAQPQFIDRIPASLRGQLIAISAELHYLRVYTTLGNTLILQGFGEALSQLGPNTGLQIHRSHWIDPSFVTGLPREGGRMVVRLATGIVLPVARNRRAHVAAALEGNPSGVMT